jgi:hypothetical protein
MGNIRDDLKKSLASENTIITYSFVNRTLIATLGNESYYLIRLKYPQYFNFETYDWLGFYKNGKRYLEKGAFENDSKRNLVCTIDSDIGGSGGYMHYGYLDDWISIVSKKLKNTKIQNNGFIAVESISPNRYCHPGVTIVVDSPFGGLMTALFVLSNLEEWGINSLFAVTVDSTGRGVITIIYTPNIYKLFNLVDQFGINWQKWTDYDGDDRTAKIVWLDNLFAAIKKLIDSIPKLCLDAVDFRLYDVFDNLHLLHKDQLNSVSKFSEIELTEWLYKN